MSKNLLPCPFCGNKAERIDITEGDNSGGSCICCTVCQASSSVEFGFKENFISNWNRRNYLPVNEWQPIETAPKDGTEIILYCPQGDGTPDSTFRLTSGSWFIPPVFGSISDPEVDDDEPPSWLSWDGGFSEGTMMPTHWMPLPAPPSPAKQAEPTFPHNTNTK